MILVSAMAGRCWGTGRAHQPHSGSRFPLPPRLCPVATSALSLQSATIKPKNRVSLRSYVIQIYLIVEYISIIDGPRRFLSKKESCRSVFSGLPMNTVAFSSSLSFGNNCRPMWDSPSYRFTTALPLQDELYKYYAALWLLGYTFTYLISG